MRVHDDLILTSQTYSLGVNVFESYLQRAKLIPALFEVRKLMHNDLLLGILDFEV